jgi:hypothetical protein
MMNISNYKIIKSQKRTEINVSVRSSQKEARLNNFSSVFRHKKSGSITNCGHNQWENKRKELKMRYPEFPRIQQNFSAKKNSPRHSRLNSSVSSLKRKIVDVSAKQASKNSKNCKDRIRII